ncbi:DUF5320 domain-containing protein [Pontiellaceae bacterium B12219]|nr:DUF5320 domain-containing protein [Pontiellaceae bacterium B12219]
MPNGNGRGPAGAGPMTGRGAGKCAGNSTAGRPGAGGRGMGRRNRCGGRGQLAPLEQQTAETGTTKEN